jgi:5-methylcytosine-specific restriction endonuclease McrA
MGVYVPVDLRRQVRAQFADCCAYCHTAESLTVATFEVDHIVPLAVGGGSTLENLCLACPTCNRYKTVRQTAEDPITGKIVPLFHPQQDKWDEHFTWSEDNTLIEGMTTIGRATIVALKMNREQIVRVRRMWAKMGEHPPQIENIR